MQTIEHTRDQEHDLTGTITLRSIPSTSRHEDKFPIPIHHPYVTLYWTGIVGPTCLGLARVANTLSANSTHGLTISCEELFTSHLGVGYGGRHSAGRRALRRIVDYGLANWNNTTTTLTVTRYVGPVSESRLQTFNYQGTFRHNQLLDAIKNNRGQQ